MVSALIRGRPKRSAVFPALARRNWATVEIPMASKWLAVFAPIEGASTRGSAESRLKRSASASLWRVDLSSAGRTGRSRVLRATRAGLGSRVGCGVCVVGTWERRGDRARAGRAGRRFEDSTGPRTLSARSPTKVLLRKDERRRSDQIRLACRAARTHSVNRCRS